jgi:hypothetical protein
MRIIKDTLNRKGQRQVTLTLENYETLKSFKADEFYRLGGQTDLIVGGYVIQEAHRIYWCSIEQEWIDA